MYQSPGLLQRTRERMRARRMSLRTEQAYLHWIRRFVAFHDRKHPRELGAADVEAFLSHLAVDRKVAASTQNQALNALLFLYKGVLEVDLPWLASIVRARRPKRLPVILSPAEARRIIEQLSGTYRLMTCLLYGSGLRITECLRHR